MRNCVLILIWITAVGLSGITPAPCGASTLTIGVGRDFYDGPESRSYLHGSTHTWEALTSLGPDLQAEPWLATAWSGSDDGRTWTFHLRDGVLFHDGTPLTAEMAAASIRRIASHPRYDASGVYRYLDHIETRGRLTLVFHLKQPSPAFPSLVAYYSSPILHPKDYGERGRLRGLTGTGPFAVAAVRPGDRITLTAFSDYWGKKPFFNQVVFRMLPDAQARLMALHSGDIDAVSDVGGILPRQVEVLQRAKGITLKSVRVATTHYLLFNCNKPPFDSRQARQWLRNRLGPDDLKAVLVSGVGEAATDPYTPLAAPWTFHSLKPEPGTCPIDKTLPVTILLHAGTLERWPYRDLAVILQARLAESGFRAAIGIREPGAYYEDIRTGQFDMALQPNTLMTGDPDFFYSYYAASDGPRNCGCGDPVMDDLIDQGRKSMNPQKRKEIYRRLSVLFNQSLPLLPLYHDICHYAHGPGVAHFEMDHNFRPLLIQARPQENP